MRASLRSPRLWLWLLILFGLGCRFYGLNWDEGTGLHPDERFCVSLVPRLAWPSLSGWFNSASSSFNPDNLKDVHYVYGQLPLMLAKIAVGSQTDTGHLLPLLRALSAFFDSLTVVFSVLIGRRILGANWGLVAGAFVSLAALNVQGSHFFTTDSFAAAFLTLAFWSGARWLDTRRPFDALGMGVFWGASLACKLSGAFFVVAFLGLAALALRRHSWKSALPLALCSLVGAFWTYRIFHPMAFQGAFGLLDVRPEPRFLAFENGRLVGDFAQQLDITRGDLDVPFNVQWIGRVPWLFSLQNLGWWGWNWALLASGVFGVAATLARPRRAPVLFVAALFALVAFGAQGAQFSKFTRYFVPLTPMMALLAAAFWRDLLAWKPKSKLVLGAALAYSLAWCAGVAAIYGRPMPRLEASRWIVSHLNPGDPVANETVWDEGLPIGWSTTGNGGLNAQSLNSFDLDTPEKRANLKRVLAQSQWIFISSGRSWTNIPRWPQKWPMMSAFYKALFEERLGFEFDREFTNYPGIGPLRFKDDHLEEALSVYDHPRVLLYRKGIDFSPERVAQVLDSVSLSKTSQFHPREAPGKWDFLPQPRSNYSAAE